MNARRGLNHHASRNAPNMKKNKRSNLVSSVAAVKQELTRWAAPSPVAQAYARFSRNIRKSKNDEASATLPDAWKGPFRALVKDLSVNVMDQTSFTPPMPKEGLDPGRGFLQLDDSLYVPANQVDHSVDHRYNIEWTYRDNAETLGNTVASKQTGHLHVLNILSPMPPRALGDFTRGVAHAGVGFLFLPKHAVTKQKVTPQVRYKYNYLIDHTSQETLSIAHTRGSIRVVVFRMSPFDKPTTVVHAEYGIPLWDVENRPHVSRPEGQHAGAFSGVPLELDFHAMGGSVYAVVCVATVEVNRGYYGGRDKPPEPTLCTGNLECDVSGIWLEQLQK